ncbi:MFS transporter [Nocardia sp. NPDC052112]|uniref:MFS transporter n=1 Tax=Nocardia sp. NPDC052112 TaxID=3155646 RepID=UPI00342EEA49
MADRRAKALGATGFLLWMVNFLVGFFFLQFVHWFGISSTFFIFFVFGCGALVFVRLLLPETKGRTLESLEHEFCHRYGDAQTTRSDSRPGSNPFP